MKKLNDWFFAFKTRYQHVSLSSDEVVKPTTTQENVRDQQTKKRVRKAFDDQQQQMQVRALKAHDGSCKDPLTCTKKVCFKSEPDKIVAVSALSDQDTIKIVSTKTKNKNILKQMDKKE